MRFRLLLFVRVDAHYLIMGDHEETLKKMQRNACLSAVFARFFAGLVFFGPHLAQAEQITAFAASSLHDALGDIASAYEDQTGTKVTLVFAASSAVARQVAQGAPADVVFLADQDWAHWLVAQGTIERMVPVAGNQLVLIGRDIAPLDDPDDIEALLGDGVLAMAQTDAVPAGRYGKAALVSLGLWDAFEPRIVQAPNVRAALRFVERGEAPLGIGYASDLVALPALSAVYSFAPDTHPQILYSAGVLTAQGADFMEFFQKDGGQKRLWHWGFSPVTQE